MEKTLQGAARLFAFYLLPFALSLQFRFVLDDESDQSERAMQIKLAAYVCPMSVYSARADEKLVGYLARGLVFGDEAKYAPLGRSEVVERGFLTGERVGLSFATHEIRR